MSRLNRLYPNRFAAINIIDELETYSQHHDLSDVDKYPQDQQPNDKDRGNGDLKIEGGVDDDYERELERAKRMQYAPRDDNFAYNEYIKNTKDQPFGTQVDKSVILDSMEDAGGPAVERELLPASQPGGTVPSILSMWWEWDEQRKDKPHAFDVHRYHEYDKLLRNTTSRHLDNDWSDLYDDIDKESVALPDSGAINENAYGSDYDRADKSISRGPVTKLIYRK